MISPHAKKGMRGNRQSRLNEIFFTVAVVHR